MVNYKKVQTVNLNNITLTLLESSDNKSMIRHGYEWYHVSIGNMILLSIYKDNNRYFITDMGEQTINYAGFGKSFDSPLAALEYISIQVGQEFKE